MPDPLAPLALPPAEDDAVSPCLLGAYPSALRLRTLPAPLPRPFLSIVTAAAGINFVSGAILFGG